MARDWCCLSSPLLDMPSRYLPIQKLLQKKATFATSVDRLVLHRTMPMLLDPKLPCGTDDARSPARQEMEQLVCGCVDANSCWLVSSAGSLKISRSTKPPVKDGAKIERRRKAVPNESFTNRLPFLSPSRLGSAADFTAGA